MKTSAAHRIETLEARIAPATLWALDNDNGLYVFDSATPQVLSARFASGLAADEKLVGIDFRPATGGLYGISKDSMGVGRIYLLSQVTGAASFCSLLVADPMDNTSPYSTLSGTNFGVDFNPVADRLRVVSDTEMNLRINVDTGFVTTDGDLNPGGAVMAGAAYTKSFAGSTSTTLYGLETANDQLVIQNPPNNGTINNVGALGIAVDGTGGFDILSTRSAGGAVTESGFAALTVGGVTGLYTVNLTTGAATFVEKIGTGTKQLLGLSATLGAPAAKAYTISGNGHLLSLNAATPGLTTDLGAISGLGGGEELAGFDFRPANGALYAVTKTAAGIGKIYTVNVTNASATLVTTLFSGPTGPAFTGLDGTNFGVDFNPVVDRLRIVSDNGQNLRVNVETGAVLVDVALNGPTTASMQAAYSNNFAGATTTTLYGIDTFTDTLYIQNPPNNGTLVAVGNLGVDAAAVGGFDIRTNGEAYAVLNVGGTAGFYQIDLGTGAASLVGALGGTAPLNGLALAPSGVLQLTKLVQSVAEGSGAVQFTVERVGGSEGTVSAIVLTDGPGAAGNFVGISRALTFGPGVTSMSFSVTLIDDAIPKGNTAFSLLLRDAIGGAALNANNNTVVNLLNDDPLSITARTVTYTDGDGDLVTLKINKGTLNAGLLKFAAVGTLGGVQLQSIDLTDDQFLNANLTVTAKRVLATGDSFANVGHINALGNVLGTVRIDGDLGQIDAASVKALTVQSMGRLGLSTQGIGGSLVSNFSGNLTKLTVKADVRDASIVALLNIGTVSIGGNLTGGAADYSGSLEAGGKITAVKVLGSLRGGAGLSSGSIIAKTAGALNIRGDIDGGHILLSGNAGATTAKLASALTSLTVGGNVDNGDVLVGYNRAGVPVNAEVTAGAVKVTGDWIASDLAVGVRAGDDGYFGTDDDRLIAPVGGVVAKIASIAVRGQIIGTFDSTADRFGFSAELIGAFKVGKAKLTLTPGTLEDFAVGATFDVRVRDTILAA